MRLSPEIVEMREPTLFPLRKAASLSRKGPGKSDLTGVAEQGMSTGGSARNLGDPVVSTSNAGSGATGMKTPGPSVVCRGRMGAWLGLRDTKHSGTGVVPPNEGNEVRRDG